MPYQAKVLAVESEDSSFISGTYRVKGESGLSKLSSALHIHTVVCT